MSRASSILIHSRYLVTLTKIHKKSQKSQNVDITLRYISLHIQVNKTFSRNVKRNGVRSFLPKNNTIIALLPPSEAHRPKHIRRRRLCLLYITTTILNKTPITKFTRVRNNLILSYMARTNRGLVVYSKYTCYGELAAFWRYRFR